MKKGFKISIIVCAMMLSTFSMTACNSNQESESYVDGMYFENVMPYQAQDLSDFISVSGTVESESSINVTSSVSAKITQLNVSVGDKVKKGDILCTLDASEIQQQIKDLETSIKNATALDENSKKLNRQALENAKYDQTIQLKQAQDSIDEAQKTYDNTYKKYSDNIDKINKCVLEYNDTCNRIAQLESEMANQPEPSYDDYDNYEDFENFDDYSYDDADFMSFKSNNVNINGFNATNLSYGNDEYSSLIAKRDELYTKIETYKQECETYEEQFDSLKKAIENAKDNYASVKRSTDQAIESAQNTVDMQDYQEDGNSNTATQLENLKKQLDECTVKAEKDGTITFLAVAQGDTPNEGALLMTIENNSQLKITVNIDEGDILKVKEGMNVIVTSEATGEEQIKGVVSKVITIISSNGGNSQSLDGSSGGTGGFTAEITIDDGSDLLVGMKAKAKIMLVEKSGCYSVLYDCIMYDDDGNPYVLVADTSASDNGTTATVKRADITIGAESGSYVEVSSNDLKENDLIITTPYDVVEGDTIELSPYVIDFGTDNLEDGINMNGDAEVEVID